MMDIYSINESLHSVNETLNIKINSLENKNALLESEKASLESENASLKQEIQQTEARVKLETEARVKLEAAINTAKNMLAKGLPRSSCVLTIKTRTKPYFNADYPLKFWYKFVIEKL